MTNSNLLASRLSSVRSARRTLRLVGAALTVALCGAIVRGFGAARVVAMCGAVLSARTKACLVISGAGAVAAVALAPMTASAWTDPTYPSVGRYEEHPASVCGGGLLISNYPYLSASNNPYGTWEPYQPVTEKAHAEIWTNVYVSSSGATTYGSYRWVQIGSALQSLDGVAVGVIGSAVYPFNSTFDGLPSGYYYRVVVGIIWKPYEYSANYGHAITTSDPCLMESTITITM